MYNSWSTLACSYWDSAGSHVHPSCFRSGLEVTLTAGWLSLCLVYTGWGFAWKIKPSLGKKKKTTLGCCCRQGGRERCKPFTLNNSGKGKKTRNRGCSWNGLELEWTVWLQWKPTGRGVLWSTPFTNKQTDCSKINMDSSCQYEADRRIAPPWTEMGPQALNTDCSEVKAF